MAGGIPNCPVPDFHLPFLRAQLLAHRARDASRLQTGDFLEARLALALVLRTFRVLALLLRDLHARLLVGLNAGLHVGLQRGL